MSKDVLVLPLKEIGLLETFTVSLFNLVKDELASIMNAKVDKLRRLSRVHGKTKIETDTDERNLLIVLSKDEDIVSLFKILDLEDLMRADYDLFVMLPILCTKNRKETLNIASIYISREKIGNIRLNKLSELIRRSILLSAEKECEKIMLLDIDEYRLITLFNDNLLISQTLKDISDAIKDIIETLNILDRRLRILESMFFGKEVIKEQNDNEKDKENDGANYIFT